MKTKNTKSITPYVTAVIIFFIISVSYFIPDVLEGKRLYQGDIANYMGMSKETKDYRAEYGKEALWTNSMFGGMPAYLVDTSFKGNKMKLFYRILTLNNFRPVCFIFLYLIGFYIALLLFRINPWLSIAGAIAYAFSSYFFIIVEAGHVSKVLALGYMPAIIAGVYASFRGKIMLGSVVTGLFLSLQLATNHLQITYYTLLIILIFSLFELISAVRENRFIEFVKPLPVLFIVVILSVGSTFSNIWTTYEYGKYSIRGKSELTSDAGNKTSGLDKDYATQWSIGIDESLSLLIPNIKGAPGAFGTNSKTFDLLKRGQGGTAYAKQMLQRVPSYWGTQPFTTPVYAGAIVCFLFVLGLFVVKGKIKWWLLTITIVSIFLSWGRNFPLLTNFMLDHFPGYNKFRAVSMTLVIAEFSLPLLGILCVKQIMDNGFEKKILFKQLKYSLYIVGGIALFLFLFPGVFGLEASSDTQLINQGNGRLVDVFREDRQALVRKDAFRSLVFILLAASLIYIYVNKKIKAPHFIVGLSALLLIDMWPVDKRYLNSENFVTKKEEKNPFTPSTADLVILNDKEPDYRVLNLAVSTFNDASTSYFHHSIGGYHGAKMERYQELIDHHISKEMSSIISVLKKKPSSADIDSTMKTLNVLNMLNTRYIIYNPEAPPLVNDFELGNAWFVENYKIVENADEEIEALTDFNPGYEAIVDKRYEKFLEKFTPGKDSTANIQLISYKPNQLVYKSKTTKKQLAVFSEIFYDKGWQAYIDGNPAPHFRVDYVLRAMLIPGGEHTIEFKFHPNSYYAGEKISLASSIILILLVIGTLIYEVKQNK